MSNSPISVQELRLKSFSIFDDQWFLLSCGDVEEHHFNSMTVSWGSIGIMWNKPFLQVVVRPTRFTLEFMEKYPDFTVCAFPEEYRSALDLLGSESGRDGDKIARSGLTPLAGTQVSSPVFKEANLIFECRKIYSDRFHPAQFIEPAIEKFYRNNDHHTIYFGEVLAINGDRKQYT